MTKEEILQITNAWDLADVDLDYCIEQFKDGYCKVALNLYTDEEELLLTGWCYRDMTCEIFE